MIAVNQYKIGEIPVLELVDGRLAGQPAPLVIYYHGFENMKEGTLAESYQIALRGFRVVVPDAINHGERSDATRPRLQVSIFATIHQNVQEFPGLIDYYQGQNLIANDFIGVAGLSMGGMTTGLLLSLHPEIKLGAIMMGTPHLAKFAQVWDDRHKNETDPLGYGPDENSAAYYEYLDYFQANELGSHPERLQGRPLYLWHAKNDDVVPWSHSHHFAATAKNLPAGQHIELTIDDLGGHRVPNQEMVKTGEFFAHWLGRQG